ncbi:MAG TPA: DEAD/DEAH box helicase [Candidatus Thermoplasmatota archaeon]|nr:DEAD/DEAH box helicase [Candidatus Thermoplasmatota archaeon]
MQVAELALDPRLRAKLEEMGYTSLYPSQEEAAPLALGGKNLVVAVPTASGKSLVAYVAMVNAVLTRGTKCLYMAPLRALASEKFEELREFRSLGIKVGLSIGDLDAADPRLRDVDILVCTSEKADALLRHSAHWVSELGLVVADEVHLLNEPDRGPTLEVLLTRFRHLNPNAQLIALSATVRNSQELAGWLEANHVTSDWRPVSLKEGVFYGRAITFADGSKQEVKAKRGDPVSDLVADSLAGGGQCLVFVNTRKSTETAAERLRASVTPFLDFASKTALLDVVKQLGGDEATTVEGRLGKGVRDGVAFHHAGLTNRQRSAVEKAFKAGLLKVIVATPTLAAGINLPARRVVVRDTWRYDSDVGNAPISVMEYKQMAGRAGRPKYDTTGEAITIAKTIEAREDMLEGYILAKPERVTSKLGSEGALRVHVLSSIAAGFTPTEEALQRFLESTFLARQTDTAVIDAARARVMRFLRTKGFVEEGERLEPTPFGRRTSQLYIDPLSAVALREALEKAQGKADQVTELGWLHALTRAPDMRNLFVKAGDDWLEADAAEAEPELLTPIPTGGGYEFFLAELKTALLLRDWINEVPEERIEQRFDVYPGDVHNKVETAKWLAYAARELAHLFNRDALKPLAELEARIDAGAKRELLPLLKLRGVGRMRARALYRAGFKSLQSLREAEVPRLVQVQGIGPGVAQSIKQQLGQVSETEQTGLGGFDAAP